MTGIFGVVGEDIEEFVAAQDELRAKFGNPVTFRIPTTPQWPTGTRINPDTGRPYDSTLVRENAEFTEITVTALVIEKQGSPLRPQTSEQFSALGQLSGMDIILDLSDEDNTATIEASEFHVLEQDYHLEERKPFALGGRIYRYLVYGMEN